MGPKAWTARLSWAFTYILGSRQWKNREICDRDRTEASASGDLDHDWFHSVFTEKQRFF